MEKLDVLIIGVGTAGEYAAGTCLARGRSTGLVERGRTGGDCIFHACIPTKSLLSAARTFKKMRRADDFGLPASGTPADYSRVKAYKDEIVESIGAGREQRWRDRGASFFAGEASFVSPHEVSVGDQLIRAERILITSGSLPAVFPIEGLAATGYITNVEALDLERIPASIAIIGGGPVGLEFGQLFSAFGAAVTIFEAGERILPREDEEVSASLAGLLADQDIAIKAPAAIRRVSATAHGKLVVYEHSGSDHSEEFEEVMLAAGRQPAMDALNLVAAGVKTHPRGISVDAGMRTNVPNIWAAGDITGTFLFTYVAGEQGETAARNATRDAGEAVRELSYEILPRVTFCDPDVGSVGLTEREARERGYDVKIGRFDYVNLTRAILARDTEGFFKIVVDGTSSRILGGHILGTNAGAHIHEVAAAMSAGLSARQVGDMLHAYPTFSEGVRYACQAVAP